MTGSTRFTSTTPSSVRAPYSAPQTTAPLPTPPARNFDPETGAALRLPTPFVPREFRVTLRREATAVTVVPAVDRMEENLAVAVAPHVAELPIAQLFNDESQQASNFASFAETHDVIESETRVAADSETSVGTDSETNVGTDLETSAGTELPWIDAFAAVETPEPEESWPLGEAGKRLDELTQSLTSLDASRERQQAEKSDAHAAPPITSDAAMSMWNEEEWIDIMPTAPVDIAPQDPSERAVARDAKANTETPSRDTAAHDTTATAMNVESAARALEGLAHRVRAGEVLVPEFPSQLGPEAMLAGLLASMLGWRQ